jgi:hypothetical protein
LILFNLLFLLFTETRAVPAAAIALTIR